MATFTVPYVEHANLRHWQERWHESPSAQPDPGGELDLTEMVEAATAAEAAQIVETMHPGCVVMTSHISKHP